MMRSQRVSKQSSKVVLQIAVFFGLLVAAVGFWSSSAAAHFLLNLNVRIFHVEHLNDGLRFNVRMPMPYLVAGLAGADMGDQLPTPAPFTTNKREDGRLVHYVDPAAIASDPDGLGKLTADGFTIMTEDGALPLEVVATRLHRVGTEPPFAILQEAREVFDAGTVSGLTTEPLYVGDTVVDVWLEARPGHTVYEYLVSSGLDPGLPDQDQTTNLILDHGPGGTKIFRSRGLLTEPVTISRSSLQATITFVKEGIKHILEGLDHVLFVLCLVIGAATLRSLAWRVTGFTLGHSVTLSLGFFGFVPQGAWFVPTIETGIALSIIYASAIAVLSPPENTRQEKSMVLITTLIGLLHGLGFSFVLRNILQVDSPDIWQSLLAFNVGVEVGQLMIVLAVWPLFWFLGKTNAIAAVIARSSIAVGCGLIAIYWTVERVAELSSLV